MHGILLVPLAPRVSFRRVHQKQTGLERLSAVLPLKNCGIYNTLHHRKDAKGRQRVLQQLPLLSSPVHSCLRELLNQCSPSAM